MLSRRAYSCVSLAGSWEEIWEAGNYFKRVGELVEYADNYAIFVGWQLDSRIQFSSEKGNESFKEKIIRLCETRPNFHAYFLMWDHAYFYSIEREPLQGRIWFELHPNVHFVFDNKHVFGAAHHEKVVIIDGRVAFCGGIDLCNDRWDSAEHFYKDLRRSLDWKHENHGPYHDLAVQVTGSICNEIQEHIKLRWEKISSIPFPPINEEIKISTGHHIFLSKTACPVDAGTPENQIVRNIEFLFRDLINFAEKQIIMEGQYFWSPYIARLLIEKMHRMRGKKFEIFLILSDIEKIESLTQQMALHQLSLLHSIEIAAKNTGTILHSGLPYAYPERNDGTKPRPIYVHSKLILIDDKYLSIGSANLASRAMRIDSELNLTLEAQNVAEKKHIRKVATWVKRHWGIEKQQTSHIRLRPINPAIKIRRIKKQNSIKSYVPWEIFFDPIVPWTFFINKKYGNMERRKKLFLTVIALMMLSAGSLFTSTFAMAITAWEYIYSTVLSSVWLLPVPFFPVAILATLHLGLQPAVRIIVTAIWVSAFFGYLIGRSFPSSVAKLIGKQPKKFIHDRLGNRSFSHLIKFLADPRASVHEKIVFQGLFCIPLPWYVLGTVLILPSALYVCCLIIDAFVTPTMRDLARSTSPIFLSLVIIAGSIITIAKIRPILQKKDRRDQINRPILRK